MKDTLYIALGTVILGYAGFAPRGDVPRDADETAHRTIQLVQPKFANLVTNQFGLNRLVLDGKHKLAFHESTVPRFQGKLLFHPDNFVDRAREDEIRKSGNDVAFYTLGLGKADRLRGPAYISPEPDDAPKSTEIIGDSQFLKDKPGATDRAFKVKNWVFYSQPVYATDEACVSCHNSQENSSNRYVKGAPIGVLLVAIRNRTRP